MISDRLIWKLEEMLSFGKQQPLHMIMKIKTVGENLFTSRVLKYKVCLYFITVLIVSFDCGLSSPGSQYWSFSCTFTVAWSGMKKISSFFNNLALRKRPSTVFWLKQAYSQPATECSLMEGKLSVGLSSPSSISFNDYSIVRNCTLRSFSKICHQIEGNLHMITFDYRTMLNL